MSQLLATLHGVAPKLSGVATIWRVEKYRDKLKAELEEEESLSAEAIEEIKPKCFDHMVSEKLENIRRILACLKNGVNHQVAIRNRTGISQGTVSLRLNDLVKSGEVVVDYSESPRKYRIAE